MASNKVAEAYVEVGAKMDKLDRDLKRTEKKVEDGFEKTGKRAGNALETPIVAAALRATAAFGGLELGVGAVNVALDTMTGDIEDAAEAVKQLPAGIGPFARQLESLLGTVTGISDQIERAEMATNAMTQAIQRQQSAADAVAKIERDRLKTLRDLLDELQLLEAAPEDRSAIAGRQSYERRVAAAREELELARKRQNLIADADQQRIETINQNIRSLESELSSGEFFRENPGIVGSNPFGFFADEDERSEIERQIGIQEKTKRQILEAAQRERDAAVKAAQDRLDAVLKVAEAGEEEISRVEQEAEAERQREAERQHQQELQDIERREREKAEAERDARIRERARTLEEETRLAEQFRREQERRRDEQEREFERQQQEALRLQRQVESTTAKVTSVSNDRLLQVGDAGFGSTAGTAEKLQPQKIESKTLDDIKAILERQLQTGTVVFA